MRHGNKKGRLNRRTSWRKATLKSLTNDLLKYQRIETTLVKARALRSYAEPLITLAKNNPDSVAARRKAFQKLCNKTIVKSLFDDVAPLYKDIQGGYTRIMPSGVRKGDGAQMAIMELTRRTISDEDLLGITKKKIKEEKAKERKLKKEQKEEEIKKEAHVAPEVAAEEKEERVVEDIKKEKAKKEDKKVKEKGLFRRFRRKSMG